MGYGLCITSHQRQKLTSLVALVHCTFDTQLVTASGLLKLGACRQLFHIFADTVDLGVLLL